MQLSFWWTMVADVGRRWPTSIVQPSGLFSPERILRPARVCTNAETDRYAAFLCRPRLRFNTHCTSCYSGGHDPCVATVVVHATRYDAVFCFISWASRGGQNKLYTTVCRYSECMLRIQQSIVHSVYHSRVCQGCFFCLLYIYSSINSGVYIELRGLWLKTHKVRSCNHVRTRPASPADFAEEAYARSITQSGTLLIGVRRSVTFLLFDNRAPPPPQTHTSHVPNPRATRAY